MLFRVGLEHNPRGRSTAYVLGHPGCYAYGDNGDQALENLPAAIQDYIDWIARREPEPWLLPDPVEIQLEETWEVYTIDEDYERVEAGYDIEAWFLHDWKPLTNEDVERGLNLLSWSREDLLAAVRGLDQEQLERAYPGERWSIAGILAHVGGAEWWYQDRLGLIFPRGEVPPDPFERLEVVRAHLVQLLPTLVGSRQVVGTDGEFWSPRKMLRRAVWHERDHTEHIGKLLKL